MSDEPENEPKPPPDTPMIGIPVFEVGDLVVIAGWCKLAGEFVARHPDEVDALWREKDPSIPPAAEYLPHVTEAIDAFVQQTGALLHHLQVKLAEYEATHLDKSRFN